jgi:glyoxylase-like metal-dependent hydrolase (beta-lactamase superfamily II)
MEILDGIHRIDAEVGGRPLYLYLFLGERNLLLDAGCATTVGDTILPYLDSLGLGPRDIDLLVITHSDLDHQGGTHALARANPDLAVACGALDRELVSDPDAIMAQRYGAFRVDHGIDYDGETTAWMREMCGSPRPMDAVYGGGETIDLGGDIELHVLHVPGHSPGHLALHDTRTGALFSGDCVQGSVYLGLDGTRKLCPTYTHVDPSLQTIARIDALAPSELHGCHWPAARGAEVAAFLDESHAYIEHVDGLVRACFAEAPEGLTLRELIERVNEGLDDPWEPALAQELVYSLHGHAERQALQSGRNADGHVIYRAKESR